MAARGTTHTIPLTPVQIRPTIRLACCQPHTAPSTCDYYIIPHDLATTLHSSLGNASAPLAR
jgi:hypothetical protein